MKSEQIITIFLRCRSQLCIFSFEKNKLSKSSKEIKLNANPYPNISFGTITPSNLFIYNQLPLSVCIVSSSLTNILLFNLH